jgi:hypothetical protein
VIVPSRARRLPLAGVVIGAVSTLWGALVAWHYHELGLTLSHYDARGHLVVARRIFDSITPGWQQIGAVWLPLPHLLNAIPAQIDFFYRTGASAVAISIASFALATGAIAWIVMLLTGSALAAAAGAAVYALNPNRCSSASRRSLWRCSLTGVSSAAVTTFPRHQWSSSAWPSPSRA